MGGYLTVPQSQSDHDYINLFLDTHVGEPMDIAANPGRVFSAKYFCLSHA